MATTALKMDGTVFKQRPLRPLAERFWEKVNQAPGQGPHGDCWEWTGYRIPQGYGYIFIERFEGWLKRQRSTHRVSYELANEPLLQGQVVMHSCDNPSCVNPAHLSVGTSQENAQDMVRKGRHKCPARLKTHCKYGHEFTVENTSILKKGERKCKTCFREHMRKYHAKKKAEKALL